MGNFTLVNIIGNVVFSGIGFVAFTYGKRMGNYRIMVQGGALMAYSYFISDTLYMYLIGTGLTAWIYLTRNGG